MKRRLGWVGAGVMGAIACAPSLSVNEDDRSGSGGSQSETGGSSSGGIPDQAGGAGGSVMSGGASAGGRSNTGGSEPEGSGGETSSGGASSTIEGRIVDLFGRPLSEIEVRLSGGERAATDEQGRFSIEDAPATYHAEFRISARSDDYQRIYRFRGLTRRDPTFQVDNDVGESEARIDVIPTNLPTPSVGDLGVAFGNPFDYSFTGDETGLDGTEAIDYTGADPMPALMRALFWKDAGASSEFFASSSQNIALNDLETTEVSVSVWDPIAEAGQLSGHIEVPTGVTEVDVTSFVNFSDGASWRLQTVAWKSDTQTFSLNAPSIPQATHSVSAIVRDEGYSWAHADGLALGADGIELKVPRRPRLQGPLNEATDVTAETQLRWTPSEAGPCSLVVLNDGGWHVGLRIVTCESEVAIGEDIFGALFEEGEEIFWSVQSHGSQTTTDAMTGSDGFFDPYYDGLRAGAYPHGKNRPLEGSFARSEFWSFFSPVD